MLDLRSINRHARNPQAGIHGDPAGFPPNNCGNDGERALFTHSSSRCHGVEPDQLASALDEPANEVDEVDEILALRHKNFEREMRASK